MIPPCPTFQSLDDMNVYVSNVKSRRWLRHFHEVIQLTTVFVTHDQEEALELADEVVVMNNAKIEQVGPPQDVFDHPESPFA